MIEVVYKWDDIKLVVPTPSCISCKYCRDIYIDEDDCICGGSGAHHNLIDKCQRFDLARNTDRFNITRKRR